MSKSRKPNILFIARDDAGCGFFRCKQPADFLNRAGLANAKHIFKNPSQADLMSADLVIMQDSGTMEASNITKFMRDNKIPYMTEYDDYVFHVSPHNEGGYMAWNPSTLFLHRTLEATRQGVGITVSTPQLARELFPYNPNIFVIPNYLDKDKWSHPTVKRSDDKIRIGWAGGNAHADDLKMISKVLDKIIKERKGKVVFETMGMTRKELAGVFPMEIFNELCPSCGYEGEIHHYPGESLDDYSTVLASKGWDIAVAPVINNGFGNAKSDLKIKEYSALGIPIVASDVTPYREAVDSGAKVLLATTFEEWYEAINSLIDDASKRSEISRENKEWVENYWIQENIHKMFDVYSQVILSTIPILGTAEDRLKKRTIV
jgi:glycosyltransferase involved in cell wall biosynthesis